MYEKENPETIQAMFDSIASSYDRTNAALSLQMHKMWNRTLVRTAVSAAKPKVYLDLCCGTGEIAFTYLRQSPEACIVHLLDFSNEMLQCAQAKAAKMQIPNQYQLNYICADAQNIPLPDQSVDAITISYGIRNVKDPVRAISEVFRVLRPSGTFGILELTRPTNPVLRFGHQLYLRTAVPLLGWCLSANAEAYQYLQRSIQNFVEPSKLTGIIRQVGFQKTTCMPLTGGIATILFAKKTI